MSRKVLIAAPVHEVLTQGLQAAGYTCVTMEKIAQAQAIEEIKDCVGIVTSTRLQINKVFIDAAPQLEWIGRMGSGMEVIDVGYATDKGIRCHSSPEGNSNAVGEHALGMLLAMNKRIVNASNEVKTGAWKREQNRGIELEGKTIGIIGFGNTGRAFAKKLRGFDVKILAYDKIKPQHIPDGINICDDLALIFSEADIISFHVPLQEDTCYYLDAAFIESMRKQFVLVNTSRGKVVDTKAVEKGLNAGKISAVCLDVWEEEPISAMSADMRKRLDRMSAMRNVIITPHIAGYSHEALYKMSKILLDRIVMQ